MVSPHKFAQFLQERLGKIVGGRFGIHDQQADRAVGQRRVVDDSYPAALTAAGAAPSNVAQWRGARDNVPGLCAIQSTNASRSSSPQTEAA